MKLEGLSILGYSRVQPSGSAKAAVNPATGEELEPRYYLATRQDVETAARLASKAFSEFRWSGEKRADLLNRIASLLETNAAEIIDRANKETALPPARLQGEMARTCYQLRLLGDAAQTGMFTGARIDQADPNRKPLPKPDLRCMMVPVGPVVVFSASNFPLAFSVAGGDTASAFAAGCPVIVKPHHGHPGTSELVGLLVQQAAKESGAPEGIFSMLFGEGREIGVALVKHPLIKAVGFTGSRTGGRALMDAAAARPSPIPVYAEMGSINPVFMFAKSLEQKAEELATGLQASVTLGVGQFCTNPGLVFVESGPGASRFLKKLEQSITATPPGTMLTAGLCSAYRKGIENFSKIEGVRLAAQAPADCGPGNSNAGAALFVTDANTFFSNPNLTDEVFGPATMVVECSGPSEMLRAVEVLDGQLTATLHGSAEELEANTQLIHALTHKAGRLVFGGFPTGVEVSHAMVHGGPYPATADGRSTSVGTLSIARFLRPVAFQNCPPNVLPGELK